MVFFWGCAQESRRGRWRGVFFARGCHYWRRCTQRLYKAALWKTPSGRCSPLGGASPPAPPRVPHQVRDDGAIAPLYHCLRRCPFPPSPPKVTAQTRRLCCWHRWRRCTQRLYKAALWKTPSGRCSPSGGASPQKTSLPAGNNVLAGRDCHKQNVMPLFHHDFLYLVGTRTMYMPGGSWMLRAVPQ